MNVLIFYERKYWLFLLFGGLSDVTVKNGVLGIHFVYDKYKRQWTGDAYVVLPNEKEMDLMMKLDKAQIHQRYLESRTSRF